MAIILFIQSQEDQAVGLIPVPESAISSIKMVRVLPRRGRTYSPERRGQAIGMLRRLTPQKVVASILKISESTVSRWWMRYQRDPEKKVPKARKSTGQSS